VDLDPDPNPNPDPYKIMTDPHPGGPKTLVRIIGTGSTTLMLTKKKINSVIIPENINIADDYL
jgi:hypothetical protein